MKVSLADAIHYVDSINDDSTILKKYKIHILRNVTVDAFLPYLAYTLSKSGLFADIKMGGYDQIVAESLSIGLDTGIQIDVDCVITFMELEHLVPNLYDNFLSFDEEQINDQFKFISNQIDTIITSIRSKTDSLIIFNLFAYPIARPLGFIEDKNLGLSGLIKRLNDKIINIANTASNVQVVDVNRVIMRLGVKGYYDYRMNHVAKSLYTREAQYELSHAASTIVKASFGKSKKVLVLDCDNTIWGGVVGEDGLNGIVIDSAVGGCFKDFQLSILDISKRGVLICLCSKNNQDDVFAVFDNRPDMALSRSDIVAHKINWGDKATNIKCLAKELNLGLDSFVFVDDSKFECSLVKQLAPDVTVICLADFSPYEYKYILRNLGVFDQNAYSIEDQKRSLMYQEEFMRNELKSQCESLDDYLLSLEMTLTVSKAGAEDIARVAQLSQRTNQFNLTTRRYTEDDILNKITTNQWLVFVASLADRFGDYGKIGVCILDTSKPEEWIINSYLLSCRALGRGVENAFLHSILDFCRNNKVMNIAGEFIPTNKNKQVENFYNKNGFKTINASENSTTYSFNASEGSNKTISFCGQIIFNGDK